MKRLLLGGDLKESVILIKTSLKTDSANAFHYFPSISLSWTFNSQIQNSSTHLTTAIIKSTVFNIISFYEL